MSANKPESHESSSALLPGTSGAIVQLAFVVAAAAGVYSFVMSARDAEHRRVCTASCALRPDYANSNRMAPDFELPTLSGETKKLSDYRGKVVILNFWTKTCRPCLREMPDLEMLAAVIKRKHSDIELITITTDESAEDARNTLNSVLHAPPSFTTFVDADNEIVADLYGTKLYPETWYIDKKGVIRARLDGSRDWKEPLHLELALALTGPKTCQIDFQRGKPKGDLAYLCDDVPLSF